MGTLRQSAPGCEWNRTAQHTHEDGAGLSNVVQLVWSRPRPLTEEVFFDDVLSGLSFSALISSLLYRTLDTWRSPQSEPVGSATPGALSEGQRGRVAPEWGWAAGAQSVPNSHSLPSATLHEPRPTAGKASSPEQKEVDAAPSEHMPS